MPNTPVAFLRLESCSRPRDTKSRSVAINILSPSLSPFLPSLPLTHLPELLSTNERYHYSKAFQLIKARARSPAFGRHLCTKISRRGGRDRKSRQRRAYGALEPDEHSIRWSNLSRESLTRKCARDQGASEAGRLAGKAGPDCCYDACGEYPGHYSRGGRYRHSRRGGHFGGLQRNRACRGRA